MTRAEFSRKTKRQAFERCKGHCEGCGVKLMPGNTEYDHDLAAALGGTGDLTNCKVLCVPCHNEKTGKHDIPRIRKADRQRDKHIGAITPKGTLRGQTFNKRPPQNSATRPLTKTAAWRQQ